MRSVLLPRPMPFTTTYSTRFGDREARTTVVSCHIILNKQQKRSSFFRVFYFINLLNLKDLYNENTALGEDRNKGI